MDLTDPLALARALVRVPSVTPDDGTALQLVAGWLGPLGAELFWISEPGTPEVPNLAARIGSGGPRLAFAGHTDVVPVGDAASWHQPPFAGEIVGDRLVGRGACDMKGGVAAAVSAVARHLARFPEGRGELWFLLTGDEEGPADRGTRAIVRWCQREGLSFDGCIVGEPGSVEVVGDTLKVGRRGSFSARITVHGVQGHAAYPDRTDNPVHRLARIVAELTAEPLDAGTDLFQPSSLQVTTIDVGNPATNVVPAAATAVLNVRFNPLHDHASLEAHVAGVVARHAGAQGADVRMIDASDCFFAGDTAFARIVASVVGDAIGRAPDASTRGGTSDARFLKDVAPVVELGSLGHSMHEVDEWIGVDELAELTALYGAVIERVLVHR
ncbi:MAG: succinyl-diaminopimelate desuccinylase [Pseudomonadota bacterium]